MNKNIKSHPEDFNKYAENYDNLLNKGLSVTGENKYYFAEKRIEWIKHILPHNASTDSIMDYGCGAGTSIEFLFNILNAKNITGVDTSENLLNTAKAQLLDSKNNSQIKEFHLIKDKNFNNEFDIVFCNGVFHHIAPENRSQALKYIYDALKKDAYFCYWENNPWNLGTKYIMSKIPFDANAQTLNPVQSQKMLTMHNFKVINTTYRFLFPKFLSAFRPLEKLMCRFPFLAQYLILCQK